MASKYLELAVILSAVDNMSGVIRNALGSQSAGYNALANNQERADAALRNGFKLGAGAKVALDYLNDLSKKYGDVQESQADLRIAMMEPGGAINENTYSRDVALAEDLSKRYAGSQMAYYDMIRAMSENRINHKDILGGLGEGAAQLSELFRTMPAETAIFAARVKNDMKVPVSEMGQMFDLLARLKQVGVGHTGSETIVDMTEFYSKAGLGAVNMGLHGLEDTKKLGALGAMYIAKGNDAASVGTTYRRIFDNISNPKKMKEMNEEAAKFGKHLTFFAKSGEFLGIDNFVAQLGTLKGMDTSAISQILGPAGSKQGLSGDVLKNISLYGTEDYQDFLRRLADQAMLIQKISELQKATNQQRSITGSDIENMEANIGKSYNPIMDRAIRLTGKLANAISDFAKNHNIITGATGGLVALAGGGMLVGSAFQFMKSAWLYSKMPELLSALGSLGARTFAALSEGVGDFTVALLSRLLPALSAIEAELAGLTLVGAGTATALIAAAAAPLAYNYYDDKQYQEQQRQKHEEMARDLAVQDSQNEANRKLHPEWFRSVNPNLPSVLSHHLKPGSLARVVSDHNKPDITHLLMHDLRTRTIQPVANQRPSLVYSPTINMAPGKESHESLKAMLDDHKKEIEQMLNSQHHDHNRTGY